MGNMKKISYKNIAAKLPAREEIYVVLQGDYFEGMATKVKTSLTVSEMSAMIADIVDTLIDMQTGEYNPEYTELVKMILQLKHYAGVTIGKNDLSYAYRVLRETDLYPQLMAHVDAEQLCQAMVAVDKRVEFMKEMILSTAGHKAVEMLAQLEQMMNAFDTASDDMNGDKMQQLLTMLGNLTGIDAAKETDTPTIIDSETPVMLPGE